MQRPWLDDELGINDHAALAIEVGQSPSNHSLVFA